MRLASSTTAIATLAVILLVSTSRTADAFSSTAIISSTSALSRRTVSTQLQVSSSLNNASSTASTTTTKRRVRPSASTPAREKRELQHLQRRSKQSTNRSQQQRRPPQPAPSAQQQQQQQASTTASPPSRQQRIDDYNRQLKQYSASRDRNAAVKADQLLQRMKQEVDIQPTQLSYTNAIVAWSRKSNDRKAAFRAQALLDEMKQLYKSKNGAMQPSKVPYTAVIAAWSKSRDDKAGQRAVTLLQEMKAYGTTFCSPNAMTYSACITALSVASRRNSDNLAAANVALKLLDECKERFHNDGDMTCRPDTVVYTAVISTLAKTGGGKYFPQVQELLSEMEQQHDLSDTGAESLSPLKPNHFTYSAAMSSCLDRSNTTLSLEQAQSLLQRIKDRASSIKNVAPNVVVFNSLLDVCSQCATRKAADLALTTLRNDMKNSAVQPDCISYCTAMAAVTRSGNPKCGTIAVELLRELQQQQPVLKPNTFVYGAAISAQAKCGDAVMAQSLFDEMESANISCNTIVYNSLISAWARSDTPLRAHALWQDMYRRYHDDNAHWLKPNTMTYNTVLGGLSVDETTTTTAQRMLDDMKRRTAAGEAGVRPDSVTYSTLIGIWSSYPGLEAAQKVEELLLEMSGKRSGNNRGKGSNERRVKREQ